MSGRYIWRGLNMKIGNLNTILDNSCDNEGMITVEGILSSYLSEEEGKTFEYDDVKVIKLETGDKSGYGIREGDEVKIVGEMVIINNGRNISFVDLMTVANIMIDKKELV